MDDNLRKGIAGVGVGMVSIVGLATTVGHPLNTAEALLPSPDAPAIVPYTIGLGFVAFGTYRPRTYSAGRTRQ